MILIPIGTKAQLIKMAPVILALRERDLPFDFVLTGQHQETMEDLINGFGLVAPAYSLAAIDEADTSVKLATWLFKILKRHLRKTSIIAQKEYHFCLVHGDTMSTLAGALIAKRHGIQVAHVEAGLRSHSIFHPFPEELTRLMVSRLSSVFYCSGSTAIKNIKRLRNNADIVDIGQNTLLDSVRFALSEQFKPPHLSNENDRYCVVSIHRFENISNSKRLRFILESIQGFAQTIKVKFVLHAATRNKLIQGGWLPILEKDDAIELLPRMRYFEFINLISQAQFLISDGGSNQEESSYLDIPCLLMRQKTERDEGMGTNVLLSEYDPACIQSFLESNSEKPPRPAASLDRFSEQPSKIIARDLETRLNNKRTHN
ncbi:UDP-N-acetyl glucosamine 2-epimerase [Marinobacter lipolyticus]|uniref:UDP-N-acetyl glucosamine 2-epimerase n=1 Tax=Marinobacter lipolyticus TaxID=209639 RepID=UPI003A8E82E1